MTLLETRFTQHVSVQRPPEVNLFRNPTAFLDLFDAEGNVGLTSLVRASGLSIPGPRQTAYRLNGKSTENDSYMFLGGSTGAIRNGMQPGVTYQARGVINVPAVLTGTANSRARRIVVFTRIGAGAYVETASAQAPNTVGDHPLEVTFTIPADASEAFVRFYHGHQTTQHVFWHSLQLVEAPPGYVSTGYWDGDSSTFTLHDDEPETGWDGEPHASTSWRVDRAQNLEIPDAELEFTLDLYAVPYIRGSVRAPMPSAEVRGLLDPRRSRDVILNAWVQPERKLLGAWSPLAAFPRSVGADRDVAKFWVREYQENITAGEIVITFASGEVRLEDKVRVVTTVRDTGAANVAELVEYALTDAGEAAAIGDLTPAASTSVPAGDRREHAPGQSNASVYESELAAIGMRLYCDAQGRFSVASFEEAPERNTGFFGVTDGSANWLGRVWEVERTLSRTDGWADAAIVKADYENSAGTRVTAYQRHLIDGATSRKGVSHSISRAMPSGYAQSIAERAAGRGESYALRMLCSFDAAPGTILRYYREGVPGYTEIVVTSATFRPGEGVMDAEGYLLA
jgi:hypothetical protein